MTKQRQILVTVTYNDLGCIIDTKAELYAEPGQKWNRLMQYLADLQLAYSPGWGANGYCDQKLYEFVTGLIEELESWEERKQP